MKYIQTAGTMLLMGIALWTTLLTSCSPDMEEGVAEEMVEEPDLTPSGPDWLDGKITVEVGRFKTGEELQNEIDRLGIETIHLSHINDIPMSGRQYTIEVEIVSMAAVGLTEPTPYSDVYDRYRERGYRPLTPEEAMEFRTQFLDQPQMRDIPWMGNLCVLMDPEVMNSLALANFYYMMRTGRGLVIGTIDQDPISPTQKYNGAEECFAVVKE